MAALIGFAWLNHQLDPAKNFAHAPGDQCPDVFIQLSLIDREHLRYIDNAGLGQIRLVLFKQHIVIGKPSTPTPAALLFDSLPEFVM